MQLGRSKTRNIQHTHRFLCVSSKLLKKDFANFKKRTPSLHFVAISFGPRVDDGLKPRLLPPWIRQSTAPSLHFRGSAKQRLRHRKLRVIFEFDNALHEQVVIRDSSTVSSSLRAECLGRGPQCLAKEIRSVENDDDSTSSFSDLVPLRMKWACIRTEKMDMVHSVCVRREKPWFLRFERVRLMR